MGHIAPLHSIIRLEGGYEIRGHPQGVWFWYLFDSFGSAVEIYQFAGDAGICCRSQRLQTSRGSVIERLLIDELLDGFLGDLMAAHKLLDLLVRLVHARQAGKFAGAHGGLDRLAKHLPSDC